MSVVTTTSSLLANEIRIAEATWDEATRVTEAYQIQLMKRKRMEHSDPAEKAHRIEEALAQLEAAERREYAAWQQLEYLRKML